MKTKLLIVGAAVLLSQAAFAAKVETCVEQLKSRCRVSFLVQTYFKESRECKIVNYAPTNTNTIFFVGFNNRDLTAVDSDTCGVAHYQLQSGEVTDQGVFEGRVFVTISSGRVVLIGRNATINELS